MKHPKSTDAYTGGHLDGYFPFDFVESSSSEDVREFSSHPFFTIFVAVLLTMHAFPLIAQEEDEDTRLRHMFEV